MRGARGLRQPLRCSFRWHGYTPGMPIGCLLMIAHLGLVARRYVLGEPVEHDDGVDKDLASAL